MKTITQQPLIEIEPKELQQLCMQVKETIANQANIKTTTQPFSVADLWRIHRSTRYRVQRRNIMM